MKRLALALSLLASTAVAEGEHGLDVPQLGTLPKEDGLAAWDRVAAVVTHPRCLNCHVDEAGVPLWSEVGEEPRPHGMHIVAGESRMGIETLPCQTCHVTSDMPNTVPHAAPHSGMDWQLAPVEMQWTGKRPDEVCTILRNPETNGGRGGEALIEHILHDASERGFITWSFDPGPGRSAPPGSLQDHLDDTAAWVAAGMPCPTDPAEAVEDATDTGAVDPDADTETGADADSGEEG
ncbi:hypothetical protein [Pseudaestuariivita sp.]|uniref:hypothetical protein n=1 Tax=Pseudaestuariivita sp. TaxID=2211669 RepID=UPI004057D0DA